MNFEGFKKVSVDGKTTVLKHPKGHSIRVVHGALSKEMRDKINSLPQHFLNGGEVMRPIEEGSEEETAPPEDAVPAVEGPPADNSFLHNLMPYASGPVNSDSLGLGQVGSSLKNTFAPYLPSSGGGGHGNGASGTWGGSAQQPEASGNAPPEVGGMSQVQPDGSSSMQSFQGMGGSDPYGKIKKGMTEEARVIGEQGKQEAGILGKLTGDLREKQKMDEAANVDLMAERKKLTEDIANGHIDPRRYLGNMSTSRKVSTAIGLIVGGMGAGILHQENPAMKALQSTIDADIDSQKEDLGKKKSLLEANMKQFGVMADAQKMTRVQMMDMASLEMKKVAAQMQDPLAKARLMMGAGKIDAAADATMQPLVLKQQALQAVRAGQAPPEALINFLPPADQAKAKEEIDRAKESQEKLRTTMQMFDVVAKAKTAGQTMAHPLRAFSGAQSEQLNGAIAELNKTLTGRFNAEENKQLYNQFGPSRLDTDEDIVLKRKNLEKYASMGMGNFTTLKKHGIDPAMFTQPQYSQQEQALLARAKQRLAINPNDRNAQLAIQKLGAK